MKGLDLGKKTELCQIFSMQTFARYFLCRVEDKSNLHALCCGSGFGYYFHKYNFIFKFLRDRILEKNITWTLLLCQT